MFFKLCVALEVIFGASIKHKNENLILLLFSGIDVYFSSFTSFTLQKRTVEDVLVTIWWYFWRLISTTIVRIDFLPVLHWLVLFFNRCLHSYEFYVRYIEIGQPIVQCIASFLVFPSKNKYRLQDSDSSLQTMNKAATSRQLKKAAFNHWTLPVAMNII